MILRDGRRFATPPDSRFLTRDVRLQSSFQHNNKHLKAMDSFSFIVIRCGEQWRPSPTELLSYLPQKTSLRSQSLRPSTQASHPPPSQAKPTGHNKPRTLPEGRNQSFFPPLPFGRGPIQPMSLHFILGSSASSSGAWLPKTLRTRQSQPPYSTPLPRASSGSIGTSDCSPTPGAGS